MKPQLHQNSLIGGEVELVRIKNWVITLYGGISYIHHLCKNNLATGSSLRPVVSHLGILRCPHCLRGVPDLVLVTYSLIMEET